MASKVVDEYRLCGMRARSRFQSFAAKCAVLRHPRVAAMSVATGESALFSCYQLQVCADRPTLEQTTRIYYEAGFKWSHSEVKVLLLHIAEALQYCLSLGLEDIEVSPQCVTYSNSEFQLLPRACLGREDCVDWVHYAGEGENALVWSLARVAISLLNPALMHSARDQDQVLAVLQELDKGFGELLKEMMDASLTLSAVLDSARQLATECLNLAVASGSGDTERLLASLVASGLKADTTAPCMKCAATIHFPTRSSSVLCDACSSDPRILVCENCGLRFVPSERDVWRNVLIAHNVEPTYCSIECLPASQLSTLTNFFKSDSDWKIVAAERAKMLEQQTELRRLVQDILRLSNGDNCCHFCARPVTDLESLRWIVCGDRKHGLCSRECVTASLGIEETFADDEAEIPCPTCGRTVTGFRVIETLASESNSQLPGKALETCRNCYAGGRLQRCGHFLCRDCEYQVTRGVEECHECRR